ncbi:MAG: FAD-dependent oxidoreductase [Alphaproteobacteria bacterium]|nr:FAD-dependent oxidoreductase [Alphaproteobacteria bacterium]MBP7761190.1 FAD-dependent oxidoreductase [Alphaproteobacteria bacterium]
MSEQQRQSINILGAGIMGLTAGYLLAKTFPQTTLKIIDPSPSGNASRLAGGMLAPYCECDHLPPEYIPAGLESIKFWKNFSKETGNQFEFAQEGSLLVCHAEDRHMMERHKALLPPQNRGAPVDLAATEPHLTGRFGEALFIEGEGHLHPAKAMDALVKALKQLGVTLANKQTDSKPDLTIDARGLGAQDDEPKLRGVKGELLIVRNQDFALKRPLRLMHPRYPLYIVPREDHVFMIGATIIESADDYVSLRSGLELMSALYSLHPTFAHAQVLEMKAGVRPAFPDNLPRIEQEGTIIRANGLFRHGFLLAPAMAACIRDRVAGTENDMIDLFIKDRKNENHPQRRRKTA